jgi:hypothetical protein
MPRFLWGLVLIAIANADVVAHFFDSCSIVGSMSRNKIEGRIIFLEDKGKQKFILKFYEDHQKEEVFCEYLGSFIGTSLAIPVNKVEIVKEDSFLKKINNGSCLATLHECVPGKELCKWFEEAPNGICLKGGIISDKHLQCLPLSDDLCDIMALDIFLNNGDRHNENCFFDEKNVRYYAIDMGDIFLDVQKFPNVESKDEFFFVEGKWIAENTYHFLSTLDIKHIAREQKAALKRVGYTLKRLMDFYPEESLCDMWLSVAQEIQYLYTESKKKYLKFFIQKNIYWVSKIIEMIEEFIEIVPVEVD